MIAAMSEPNAWPVAGAEHAAVLADGHNARTEANSRLTALAGIALFVLLAVQGVTILRIGPLLGAHIVVGFVLLGPLAVKLGSVGWRFVHYYAGDVDYRRAGPPRPVLRVLAPILVVSTVVMFATGVGLIATTPRRGSVLLLAHKASFVVWFAVTTVHVLAYVTPAARWSLADLTGRGPAPVIATRTARQLVLSASLLIGVALGLAGLAWAHPWMTSRR
jgi:hypothetical protein